MEPSPRAGPRSRSPARSRVSLARSLPLCLLSLEVSSSSDLYFRLEFLRVGFMGARVFSRVKGFRDVVAARWPLLDSPSKGRRVCPHELRAGGDVLQQEPSWLLIPRWELM